jgi:opacity protein-like surface antigen
MFGGKFIHKDIHKTPALKNEKLWCFISHYLIGIILAGIYLFLELKVPAIRYQLWMPLLFGIATVILPWLWLLPSIGLGFLASKSSNRSLIIRTNLVNHTSFGLEFIMGVEWMFYTNMTVSAEYGLNAGYSKYDTVEKEGETIQESTRKTYNLNYNRVKFGLSVYF